MHYQRTTLYKILIGVFVVLQNFTLAAAADFESAIELDKNASVVRISGRFTSDSRIANKKNLGFLDSASGIPGLGKRVAEIKLLGKSGTAVAFRKLVDGEYVAESDFEAWEYTVDLSPNFISIAAGHVSWLTNENGILMLDDLLPQFTVGKQTISALISLRNRAEWSAASGPDQMGIQATAFDDYRKGVIYLGKGLRDHRSTVKGKGVNFTFSGNWHFTDQEAIAMTEEVIAKLADSFGSIPDGGIRIGLFKFPISVGHGSWEAETRGNSVTIVSSDMPFRTQSLQRLHEQLRHELFHLWIPNGVNLIGNYSWFYEGFALYNSLKMAVEVKRISFDDMLDTLSRAISIDSRQSPRRPLFDKSIGPSARSDTTTYARGMLVAFLLDVELIGSSGGKFDIRKLLHRVYASNHERDPPTDGNRVVVEAIGARDIITKYVTGTEIIDILWITTHAGLTIDRLDRSSGLKIVAKPDGRQREILRNLSYNTWRSSNRFKK